VLIHCGVVVMVLGSWFFFSPVTTLFWGGILVAAGYVSIAVIETRRSPLRISPLSVYFFWYSVNYGFAAIYMSRVIAGQGYVLFVGHVEGGGLLAAGYAITLAGSLAFHAGLQALRPWALKSRPGGRVLQPSITLGPMVLLWAVGLPALYRPVLFGFLGAAGLLLSLGPLAALLLLATLPARTLRLSQTAYCALLLLGTAGLAIVSLGAWYDSKQTAMLSLAPLLAAAMVRPRLRKYVPAMLAFMAFVYLAAVAPVINQSRTMPGRAVMSPMSRFIGAFERYSPLYTGDLQTEFLKQQADHFLQRVFEPVSVGTIAGLVQTSGLKDGATMSNLAYGFVPRILWPGKPRVNRGAWFTAQLGRRDSVSSTGMSAAGELYWNFGWLGVMIGMGLLGALVSGLWRMAGTDPRERLLHMWLFVYLLYGLIQIAEASSYLLGLVYALVFFGGLAILLSIARQIALESGFVREIPFPLAARQPAAAAHSGRKSS